MMTRKISVFLLLCVAAFLHEVATAQSLSIFAKQKVVIWEILDRNDQPLDESFKRMIYQGIVDACTNSDRYEVYNVNIEDIKQQIKAKGLQANFPNICKMIGQTAGYIIFAEVEASRSAVGSQDVTLHISMSLYRIETASKVLSAHEDAAANQHAIISAISRATVKLGVLSTAQNLLTTKENKATSSVAFINSNKIIESMPETKIAEAKLKEFDNSLTEQLKAVAAEYDRKYQEYLQNHKTYSNVEKNYKERELNNLTQRYQQFQEQAQQAVLQKQNELMQPIIDKVKAAIDAVAEAMGCTIIEENQILSKKINIIDLNNAVKQKLGIE